MTGCARLLIHYFIVEKQKVEYIPDAKESCIPGDTDSRIEGASRSEGTRFIADTQRSETEDMSLQRAIQAVEKTETALVRTEESKKRTIHGNQGRKGE